MILKGTINKSDFLKPVLTPVALAQQESTGNGLLCSALSRQQDQLLTWRISQDCLNQNPSEDLSSTASALTKTRKERYCWLLRSQILEFCHFQDLCLPLSRISINTWSTKSNFGRWIQRLKLKATSYSLRFLWWKETSGKERNPAKGDAGNFYMSHCRMDYMCFN